MRDLEISLRTNHIEWVKEFLDSENQGLDALVDYLSFRLSMMRHEQRIQEVLNESEERISNTFNNTNGSNDTNSKIGFNGFIRPGLGEILDSPSLKRRSRHIAKLNMGASTDDIHVCIMCLRAIMNNKYGFNMVIQHREAINCIALSINHKSLRTKALVLELLAAICLVKGGHEIILSAFDNFKDVCIETKRFSTLMEFFMNYDFFNIDFMVACMQFVNIVVHSVEDMNYRVHLQYEFTSLGLDNYLEKLRLTESEELHVQISAYLDNVFDVASLMEDSETKTAALEKVQDLEDDLGRAMDRVAETEREFLFKLSDLENELQTARRDREELLIGKKETDEEISTLRRVLQKHEQESKNRQSLLESKVLELETLTKVLPDGTTVEMLKSPKDHSKSSPVSAPPPPPPPLPSSDIPLAPVHSSNIPVPPKPFPKPPPMMGQGFIPPPPMPGSMIAPEGAMTIKRKVQTKYKLPTLNWIALKPNQVRKIVYKKRFFYFFFVIFRCEEPFLMNWTMRKYIHKLISLILKRDLKLVLVAVWPIRHKLMD